MNQYIIVSGGPVNGFGFIGPFSDHQSALTHAELNCSGDWWITLLASPENQAAPKVLIEVRGGVAECTGNTHNVDVEVFDWDNWFATPEAERAALHLDKAWGELNPALPLS